MKEKLYGSVSAPAATILKLLPGPRRSFDSQRDQQNNMRREQHLESMLRIERDILGGDSAS